VSVTIIGSVPPGGATLNVRINNGDATFTDRTVKAIGIDTKKGMNAEWGDFDGDGWLDVYVTNITDDYMREGNFLWRNNGDLTFMLSNSRRIGVSTMALTKQLADYFGVTGGKGVLVTAVTDDGPAAKAGLRAGDIIEYIDNKATRDISLYDAKQLLNGTSSRLIVGGFAEKISSTVGSK